jgi:hypothetical protein
MLIFTTLYYLEEAECFHLERLLLESHQRSTVFSLTRKASAISTIFQPSSLLRIIDRLDDVPKDYDYVFNELAMLRSCDDSPKEAFLANTPFAEDLVEHCRTADGIILVRFRVRALV